MMLLRDGSPALLEGEPEPRASDAASCHLVEELLEDEVCDIHDGVEAAREEEEHAVCACRG